MLYIEREINATKNHNKKLTGNKNITKYQKFQQRRCVCKRNSILIQYKFIIFIKWYLSLSWKLWRIVVSCGNDYENVMKKIKKKNLI